MRISELEVADKAIEQGEWRDAEGLPGVRVLVKGTGNVAYRRLQAKLLAERRVPEGQQMDPAASDEMMATLVRETILCGWEGLTELPKGATEEVELRYEPAAAERLLKVGRFRTPCSRRP